MSVSCCMELCVGVCVCVGVFVWLCELLYGCVVVRSGDGGSVGVGVRVGGGGCGCGCW